ncbi:MAG: hypothetical protein RSD28_08110, partial [Lachnospiraceae bacterium]
MKQKLQQFMAGRYGADQLGQIYLGASIVFLLISVFTKWDILWILAVALLGYEYYRMLSKKVEKHYEENQ